MTLKKLVMLCNEIIFKSSLDIKTLSFKLQPWSPLTDQLYSVLQFAKSKRLLIYFFNMEKMCIINTNCRIYKHYEWHYHPLFSVDADGLWTNNVLYRNCIQMLIPMSKQELPAIPGGKKCKKKRYYLHHTSGLPSPLSCLYKWIHHTPSSKILNMWEKLLSIFRWEKHRRKTISKFFFHFFSRLDLFELTFMNLIIKIMWKQSSKQLPFSKVQQ